jgi:hypothetical protein
MASNPTTQSLGRLELEALLEGGLYALGAPLQRRVYTSEYLVGQKIDEDAAGISVGELLTKHGLSDGLLDEAREKGLLKRVEDWFCSVPYFRRTSVPYKGITLEYNAYQITGSRKIKNLRENHFAQDIKIYAGKSLAARVLCLRKYPKTRESEIRLFLQDWALREKEFGPAIQSLRKLDGREFDPHEVYCAVMDFLKQAAPFPP